MAKKKNNNKNVSHRNTRSKVQPTKAKTKMFITCPTTGDKIWLTTANLADLKKVAKTGECPNSKRKQLVRITSKTERLQRYQEAAEAIQAIEERLLPPYGGRPWKVVCRISEPNTRQKPPLFRWFRGRLELACIPHLLEKIPDPPRFKGAWAFENSEEDEEGGKTSLQERAVSSLSTAAWLDREHAIPNIKLKWLSPNHTFFYSRKAAWEHAAELAEQDVFLDKVLLGLGARGQELRPTKVTKALALKAGKLRFLRDGLWVVGQEEAWQEERAKELEQSLQEPSPQEPAKVRSEETPLKAASKCQDIETVSPSDQPEMIRAKMSANQTARRRCTGLVLYIKSNRERHRNERLSSQSTPEGSGTNAKYENQANKSNTGFTLHDADCELRVIWKGLGQEERRTWDERAKELNEAESAKSPIKVSQSPSGSLIAATHPKYPTSQQNFKSDSPATVSDTNLSSSKERGYTGLVHYLKFNRESYRNQKMEEHQQAKALAAGTAAIEFRFTLKHADKELREVWKSMPPGERAEWDRKAQEFGDQKAPFGGEPLSAMSRASSSGRVTPSESSSNDEIGSVPKPVAVSTDVQEEDVAQRVNNETSHLSLPVLGDPQPASTYDAASDANCGISSNETKAPEQMDCKINEPNPIVELEEEGILSTYGEVKYGDNFGFATANSLSYNEFIAGPDATAALDVANGAFSSSSPAAKKRRRLAECPPRRFNLSSHWRLSPEHIEMCYDAAMSHFDTVMHTVKSKDLTRELEDGFDVLRERGRGRYDMELPVFDSPAFDFLTDLQKAPWMPVVREILGEDVVLIHKGVFLSLPGAEPQVYHQDGIHLTTQTQRPCHAINVFVPLVDLSPRHGPTQFCLGSHILGFEDLNKEFLVTPTPTKGTPIIFDYRLGHKGLGNTSSSPRPLVYCTYAAAADGKEFRDSVNFSRKRYRKIGEFVERPLSRDERRLKRERELEDREIQSVMATIETLESNVPAESTSSVAESATQGGQTEAA